MQDDIDYAEKYLDANLDNFGDEASAEAFDDMQAIYDIFLEKFTVILNKVNDLNDSLSKQKDEFTEQNVIDHLKETPVSAYKNVGKVDSNGLLRNKYEQKVITEEPSSNL